MDHRLDHAIQVSQHVLDALDDDDPTKLAAENILVSHGVVLLYSECEQRIKAVVKDRCGSVTDAHVLRFAHAMADRVTGKMTFNDLKGTLGYFSGDVKLAFGELITSDNDERLLWSWERMYNNRKLVAHHGDSPQITLQDLLEDVPRCRKVVDHYQAALSPA